MAEAGTAFAMAEYVVPTHGKDPGVTGGTMPKAAKDKGGLFAEVNRVADAGPGPEKYHKDILERNFVQHLKGGRFSGMGRDWSGSPGKSPRGVVPSVGSYQVDAALDKTKKRPTGGQISKNDRKCFFALQAAKNTMPAPGKYDPKTSVKHVDTPVFGSPRNESRSPKKQSPMGPGYYDPSYAVVEKKVLSYSSSKGSMSFLDKIMSSKDKTPPPGHVGIPTSRWEDRAGRALHAVRLLMDRPVVPRPGRAAQDASPSTSPERSRQPVQQ